MTTATPSKAKTTRVTKHPPFECIALLLQGGGALGSYQAGVYEALADAMFLDVTGRTAKRLLALADGDDHFRMPLTQEELAGMVGASRERVNKAIALFVKLGWLEVSGRSQYHILDRAELQARAIS